jgi:hypothetical protein
VLDTAQKEPESETLTTTTQPDKLPLAHTSRRPPNTRSSRRLTIVVACLLGLELLIALLLIVADR